MGARGEGIIVMVIIILQDTSAVITVNMLQLPMDKIPPISLNIKYAIIDNCP